MASGEHLLILKREAYENIICLHLLDVIIGTVAAILLQA